MPEEARFPGGSEKSDREDQTDITIQCLGIDSIRLRFVPDDCLLADDLVGKYNCSTSLGAQENSSQPLYPLRNVCLLYRIHPNGLTMIPVEEVSRMISRGKTRFQFEKGEHVR